MAPAPTTADAEMTSHRDALRVQIAAVAAQQAALLEEECRLKQHQEALTRQQEQLAAHLDEKRQRVLQSANQVQAARNALERERQDRATSWAQQAEALDQRQREVESGHKELAAERQKILVVRRRLKKHFQRRFAAERKQLRKREAAVSDQHRRIENEAEKLQRDRADLVRARLSLNGDMELAKRQLQAERQRLTAEQNQWREERIGKEADFTTRSQRLRQREDALANAEKMFGAEKQDWELKRQVAEQECQGLEERIVNQRRKLADLGKVDSGRADHSATASTVHCPPSTLLRPPSTAIELPRTIRDAAVQMDRFADELAARRWELIEYWQHVALTQQEWVRSREEAAEQLAALAGNVAQREQAVVARQAALRAAEAGLGNEKQELARYRQQLEGWAARIRLRDKKWQGERERLLIEVRGREDLAEKNLQNLGALRQKWAKRRRQELDLLDAERAACSKLRDECNLLRQECWKRDLSLEQQLRELAEKTLALEEFREQLVLRSEEPASTESRVERLRKRWAQLNSGATRMGEEQMERLKAEASRLQQRGRDLLVIAEELTEREAALSQRQSGWEQTLFLSETEQIKLHQQLQIAGVQNDQAQRQLADLEGEVERLAQLLLEAVETPVLPAAQAA